EPVMFRCASIPCRRMLILFATFLASLAFPAAAATQARVSESYGKLPLHFEANRGQTDKAVRFLSRGPGYSLYLTNGEAVLVLAAARGDVRLRKPVIYQEIDGVRQEIAGRYVRKGANRIGFKLAAYDATRPLVIDPVLSYSTYLGGSQDDYGWGIAVDALGNAYATGIVSANFPTTPGAFNTECAGAAFSGCTSAFVTKLDPTGTVLYSTYLYYADAFGIAVDAIGNAYVTGRVNAFGAAQFPTT